MPISSVAMSVEGVLQKSHSTAPLAIGIALYHSLKQNFNILLYTDQEKTAADYWLSMEALNIHAAIEYNEGEKRWLPDPERKTAQLNSLRQRAYRIELVIEPDPESAALMVYSGFNVANFIHSQYAMPQWRPDFTGKDRKWETLEKAAIQAAELRAIDHRLKEMDERNEWQ